MPDQRITLEGCPLETCDLPVDMAFRTTDGCKLTTQNLVHERVCITPTTMDVDGSLQPAFVITYHNELDPPAPEFTAASAMDRGEVDAPLEVADEEVEAGDDGAPDEGADDPLAVLDGLTEFEKRIYLDVKGEGETTLAGIQGKMLDTGRSPGEIKASVNQLVSMGILDEVDEETYAVADG